MERFRGPLPPPRENDLDVHTESLMRDEETIQQRLEQLRGQFLQWGTPELRVLVTTKDELRGRIHALEWILGRNSGNTKGS